MLAYGAERSSSSMVVHLSLMVALLSFWPALVLGQASKTSQIASATKAMQSLGSPSASSFCTAYMGGNPKTVGGPT